MKKSIFALAICLILTGCTSSAQTASTDQVNTENQEQSNSTQSIKKADVLKMVVQRGHDIIVFEDNLPAGLLANADDFYTFAYRKEGKHVGVKNAVELPFLKESQEEGTSQNDYTYIRLIRTPYNPEEGENAPPRKDVVVYLDKQHPNDAFVGEQNPKKLDEWTIYQVKDYGNWLQKEIDLYLALNKGL